uniref:Uncharacterized protein n=1 Tax=Macaca mulatta TaxID=9544 RepID=A0A5F8ATY0_MACMU
MPSKNEKTNLQPQPTNQQMELQIQFAKRKRAFGGRLNRRDKSLALSPRLECSGP